MLIDCHWSQSRYLPLVRSKLQYHAFSDFRAIGFNSDPIENRVWHWGSVDSGKPFT